MRSEEKPHRKLKVCLRLTASLLQGEWIWKP